MDRNKTKRKQNSVYIATVAIVIVLLLLADISLAAKGKSGKASGGGSKQKSAGVQQSGWISLFNGKDLTGWTRHENLPGHGVFGRWYVEDGAIVGKQDPPGKGGFLTTLKEFENFELEFQFQIEWPFDSGVFLRTGADGKSHQVTIDYREGGQFGKIYLPWTQSAVHLNPEGMKHYNKGKWNNMRIFCAGEPALIQVWLNDTLITNFQHTHKTTKGVPSKGTLSLQVHPGGKGYDDKSVKFRNIRIRPLPDLDEGFVPLFNGVDLTGWTGDTENYPVEDGLLVCRGKDLYTEGRFGDFHLKFKFQLTEGANNGLGVRMEEGAHAAYDAMELQILDNSAERYAKLKPYQYHGSIYGVVPAKRGALKPVGRWNTQEVIAKGSQIKVIVNGQTIVDADIAEAAKKPTLDGKNHPGLKRTEGHLALLGHGSVVKFKDIRIKNLK